MHSGTTARADACSREKTSLLPLLRDRALAGLALGARLTLGHLVESGVGGWVGGGVGFRPDLERPLAGT